MVMTAPNPTSADTTNLASHQRPIPVVNCDRQPASDVTPANPSPEIEAAAPDNCASDPITIDSAPTNNNRRTRFNVPPAGHSERDEAADSDDESSARELEESADRHQRPHSSLGRRPRGQPFEEFARRRTRRVADLKAERTSDCVSVRGNNLVRDKVAAVSQLGVHLGSNRGTFAARVRRRPERDRIARFVVQPNGPDGRLDRAGEPQQDGLRRRRQHGADRGLATGELSVGAGGPGPQRRDQHEQRERNGRDPASHSTTVTRIRER